jgi:23S rRNA (uracil1939-C5)-methyltransferase
MKKNDVLELEITGTTHDGMGVGKKDGMAVFVQGTFDGEYAQVKVIKISKTYAIARVEELIRKSPYRQEPFCPIFKRCGGCSLQHMSYEKQLKFKHRVVEDSLARIGGIKDIKVNPVIGMENPMRYRNKAQYPIGVGINGAVAGFYARHSHQIVSCETCEIQHSGSQHVVNLALNTIRELNIPIYNEEDGTGIIRHIVTRVAHSSGDIMVIVVVTREKFKGLETLIKSLKEEIPSIKSIVLNINTRRDNVILADKTKIVYGNVTLIDRLGTFVFHIPPLAFYQVNPFQTLILYEKACEYAALTGNETVFDLYCGIGTLSLFLAQKAKRVIGVEVVQESVKAASYNAKINQISNVEFNYGLAEEIVPKLYDTGLKADVVVVDPPRKGCDKALLEIMLKMQPNRIVYVSCNPSTLARDLKYLGGSGYKVCEVQPVDMFPWTEHVECVVLITRNM